MSKLYKLDVPNAPHTPAFDLVGADGEVGTVFVPTGTVATLVNWIQWWPSLEYPGTAHLMLPDGQVIETFAIAHPKQVLPSDFIRAWVPLEV